ncbi:MAG: TonB-dependent receptor [Saprospiraceae bacterium]|nr:TonB-dependent receptor [Saprospiraceae bacterium]
MKLKTKSHTSFRFVLALFFGGLLVATPIGATTSHETGFSDFAHNVSGTILSDEGDPLIGVTVLVKGTSVGTVSDFDGKYSLDVEDANGTLVYSYTGYEPQEIAINGRSIIDITLALGVSALEEVVVVGYGSQKKVNLTGAVTSITSEALENRPIASVGQGLQGLVPNLNITIRNGDPAQGANFNIRGFESINGGEPLILVDGVPMALERINPNDIASVNVLKDASAAAVYGARAAFGVILVETKRGKTGRAKISLSTELSAAKPIFHMDPVNDPYQFVLARNQANIRTSGAPSYNDDFVAATKAFSEGTGPEWGVVDGVLQYYGFNNYQNEIMTDFAPQQRYDFSVSGATERASYYVSLGHLNKDGYLKPFNNEKFKRYNVLMKADFKITDWLTLEEKIVVNTQNSDKPTFYHWDVNVNTLARVNPVRAIQFPDLDYYLTPGDRDQYEQYIGMYFGGTNFFPYLKDGGRRTFKTNDTWLTQGVTMTPLEGLVIKGNFSYNNFHRDYQDVQSKVEVVANSDLTNLQIDNGFSGTDFIENRSDEDEYFALNAYMEYTPKTGPDHYVKGMVGYNQESGTYNFFRARAFSLITPLVTDLNATTGGQQTFGGKQHFALRGAFYRFNYIYKDKYLFEANGRYDGTSRFPKDDRFGFFPSFSVGYRISEEPFMASTRTWLDNLKIRASYGQLGNQNVNSFYPYIATMGIGTSPYMFTGGSRAPYVSPAGLVSPTLTWETAITKNIGFDITMFNNKIDFSFDAYTRDTKDMLTDVEFPSTLGTSAPQQNAADLRTSGWELAATWRDKIGQDLRFRLTLALSDWQTEITKYENPTGALSEFYEGMMIGEIWGYETVGIFQTEEEVAGAADQSRLGANWRPGDIHYADLNGDGIVSPGNNTLDDPGDRRIMGNESPRYSFGINLDLHYKAFSLTTFFQGIGKRDYWPNDGNWTYFFPYNAGHVEWYYLTDTWTEDNRDAYFPAAHISTRDGKNKIRQTRFMQDASYIRLKNLTLSYRLPVSLAGKVGLSNAEIYVAGMNLWEASAIRKPLDPESLRRNVLASEFNFNGAVEYPLQRIYSVGVRLGF